MRGNFLGSKIVQVKGVMPPKGDRTQETPTGRAVGRFVTWHNFSLNLRRCYAISAFRRKQEEKWQQQEKSEKVFILKK